VSGIKNKAINLKDRLIYNIKRPEMRILPGQLAFFFFITLIPLLTLLASLISKLNLPYSSISDLLNEYFPNGTANLLEVITTDSNFNFNIFVFYFSALVLSSNGTHSIIIASNQIYKIKDSTYIKRRLKALLLMIVVFLLLLFILVVPVLGDMIMNFIEQVSIKKTVMFLYKFLKYPLSFGFIYFLIKTIYITAPDKEIKSNNVTYGALFTTISWIVLTQGYSIYVENFTNYTTFYGSIASILILMLWLYFLAYLFVLGMALNVTRYEIEISKA